MATPIALTAIGLALAVAVGGLAARQALAVTDSAGDLRTAVSALHSSLSSANLEQATADLAATRSAAGDVLQALDSPTGRILSYLPATDREVRTLHAAATSVIGIADAGAPLLTALAAQPTALDRATTLVNATAEVTRLSQALATAHTGVLDAGGPPLRYGLAEPAQQAVTALAAARAAVDALDASLVPLQYALGMRGPTKWLVMAQNPAESRGSGGLFNAYLIVEARDGQPTIVEAGSRKRLDGEFPRAEQIPYLDTVDVDTAHTWGPVLGEWASMNMPADFPTVARLAAAGMAQRGSPVDGVVAIDPFVVQAVLAGTGPVEHKGTTIDAANAADYFMRGLYVDYPGITDVEAKDELAMGLTYATVDAALARPLDLASLAATVPGVVAGGHVRAWSSNPTVQAWLETTPVAGSLRSQSDEVVVAFNNATGSKLDSYARREVTSDARTCAGTGIVTTEVHLANDAPTGLPAYVDLTLGQDGLPDPSAPAGQTLTYVTAYPPVGWRPLSVTLPAGPVEPVPVVEAGRRAWLVPVALPRGTATTLAYRWRAPTCPPGA